ncbi:MAG TPA: hypothetical protein VGQ02_05290 [Candidatus Limnocylindrales bacterium]|nr:hypothetical protein [Candidatus Limnocylindrales bacterium]
MADHGSHVRHDRFAIAGAIGGGALPSTIGSCPACRALHVDLLTLQGAVRAAWVPRRTRDLRLTIADPSRLRHRWRRLVGMIGTPRDALTRPLALSFTSLGLAGLLLTAVPAGLPMGAAGAAAPELDRTMVAAGSLAPLSTVPQPPTIGGATAARDEAAPPNPLPGLSFGLLTIGAALFVVRRVARGVGGVR